MSVKVNKKRKDTLKVEKVQDYFNNKIELHFKYEAF